MNAKQYLSQAFLLDQQINSKIEQVDRLNELATKCTSVITDMPRKPNVTTDAMTDTVGKIISLQGEINRDIDALVDLKAEIVATIGAVGSKEYRILLEKRYLCYESWKKISDDMGFGIDNIFKMHGKALLEIKIPKLYS